MIKSKLFIHKYKKYLIVFIIFIIGIIISKYLYNHFNL